MQNRKKIRDMVYISLGAVFIAVGAWITVPFAIPFTMQTFAVFLVLDMFGGKRGTAAIILYIALGIVGVPVFSGFRSGEAILGPTGGYIFGFVISGFPYLLAELFGRKGKYIRYILPFVSHSLCLICGTVWYVCVFSGTENPVAFGSALSLCVVPYLLPDTVKILLALFVSKRLKRILSD